MVEKKLQINAEGYSIRCRFFVGDHAKSAREFDNVVIMTHGFGSSKDTAGTKSFAEHLLSKYKDWAVITFDWPCHGEDARKKLSVEECLEYLTIVTDYAKNTLGAKTLYNYSTSFGGYLTLRYIIEVGNPFKKIALRCPGVNMYESMSNHIDAVGMKNLEKGKEIQVGFERKMKIDQSFMDSLKAFDVRNHEYFDYADDMLIIHGTKDEMIPIELTRKFAEDNVIEFIPVEGANHPFQNPQHMALAIHAIVEFFGK
ncbi:MAG: alpha/beta hydrolase [Acidaminococcus sp.]|jgi:pimeloyl-ACP methyl ester carboxylesterase|nr:alpha/beta hydrolase [Acidaminococcus sp.]MCI2100157.1 alpha/beta hydrolase [Acidaminococcus sp.]MCI2114476.1 alpha/beta hydrolase [Acidaminococcus sp.]MCI2116411.1 alpha/beta hydrolase [Acidaminococcus sp.]